MTQGERVLKALRDAGQRGVTAVDFSPPVVCDGGEPIMRVGARIFELRAEGYRISDAGRRNKCRVYVLDAATPAPTADPLPPLAAVRDEPVVIPGQTPLWDEAA